MPRVERGRGEPDEEVLASLPLDLAAVDRDSDPESTIFDDLHEGLLGLEETGGLDGGDEEAVEHGGSQNNDGGVHERPRDESVKAVVVHEDDEDWPG